MKTFKQFLHEIDFDNRAVDFIQSHSVVQNVDLNSKWRPLLKLEIGQSVVWRKSKAHGIFEVALVGDDGRAAIYMELDTVNMRVASQTLTGVETSFLASHIDYRGKDLPLKIYQALVDHGQVLFSSYRQTAGSRRLWEKLVRENTTFVLASNGPARWYARKYGEPDTAYGANVLLTGSIERLNDEAYADRDICWVVVPDNLPGLDILRKEAIHLD